MWYVILLWALVGTAEALTGTALRLVEDYTQHKDLAHVYSFTCDTQYSQGVLAKRLMRRGVRMSASGSVVRPALRGVTVSVGVLLDASCAHAPSVLRASSAAGLFDAQHAWLVLAPLMLSADADYLDQHFQALNLSVDADIAVANHQRGNYNLTDVFNFGKIQGNKLEKMHLGTWTAEHGLIVSLNVFKYYDRWDFHKLTLRAVSVVLGESKVFYPEMLSEVKYTPGVNKMTKIPSMLLNIIKELHNFRFNYTIAGRWTGPTERNSTLAVTNSLYWGEQDIASTGARMFSNWYAWVDIIFPPVTRLETKFYYLIPESGVGSYEDRFLTPLSLGAWGCACGTAVACALVLVAAARRERRPSPALYAIFSVLAATCQQGYEDGVVLLGSVSSQARRAVLVVFGLTSMVLYNYYTSSVVSWLLSAPPSTIPDIDGLIRSDLQLVFEDIGYTRSWIDYPGFFYLNGFKDTKEDILRERKVTNAKRTVSVLQSIEDGIALVRKGGNAFHTEPYAASQVIARTFGTRELCDLATLQMVRPADVYIYVPKRSPYKQFFVWSVSRLQERGLVSACSARVGGGVPTCPAREPRALALGQAAPALLLLSLLTALSLLILILEILWKRCQLRAEAANRPIITTS